MPTTTITVRHNVEMAHRLIETAGKCEAIHGHSWWIDLTLGGFLSPSGMLNGLDFGEVKKLFRAHLDILFDHHTLLNAQDEWAQPLALEGGRLITLPGLQVIQGDPTTENFAGLIGDWALKAFNGCPTVEVTVHETSVNSATWRWNQRSGDLFYSNKHAMYPGVQTT